MSDMERSLAFWRDLLGLEEAGRGVVEWEHLDRLVALPDTKIEWVELRDPGRRNRRALAVPPTGRCRRSRRVRRTSPAGRTSRYWSTTSALCSRTSVRPACARGRTRPVDIPVGAYAGGKAVYVFDPDGVEIELIQRPNGRRDGG